jgi:glycerate kinase
MLENLSGLKNTEFIVKPVSDGGDGFLNVCRFYFGGEVMKYLIPAAYANSEFECPVVYCEKRKEIYIESAEVLGLKVVPLSRRNPLKLSSKGLGKLLNRIDADIKSLMLKADKVYLGVGGTATIDMGMGAMSKLGLKLTDASGKEINVLPENFNRIADLKHFPSELSFELIPVVDVMNPLLGPEGGVRVYGKQKNADDAAISVLEGSFKHLLNLFENKGLRFSSDKLSGAGGGIPAAFQLFYNAEVFPSDKFIRYHLGLSSFINDVDCLITGEGAYDHQSDFGKGTGVLLNLFSSNVKQIFLVCGKINSESIRRLPENVFPIEIRKYFSSGSESIAAYEEGIKRACRVIVKQLNF